MAGLVEWQMVPAVAAGLENLGWRSDDPELRDIVPAVLRGSNVVAVLPPAPAWADATIAALLGRTTASPGGVLVLAAPALVAECAMTIGALTESTALHVEVARSALARLANQGNTAPDILVASPETALHRHTRSELHPDRFRAVLFAWPEEWAADETIAMLLADVPRDAQRVVLTARADALDGPGGLLERYARKAVIVRPSGDGPAATGASPTVRVATTSWAGRAATVAAILDTIDQPHTTIWTADSRDHQLVGRTLGALRPGIELAIRTVPTSGTVICYDPPTAPQLAQLAATGEVILLLAPGLEGHFARVAPNRRPMILASPMAEAVAHDAALRAEVSAVIDAAGDPAAYYALGPLFELHDAQSVAAALFRLWRGAVTRVPAPSAAPARTGASETPATTSSTGAPNAGTAKLWIGAGKRDDATVADFVAVLVREVGLERSRIGRIELRDTFALVEVPAAEAEAIAMRLGGITIRKRKLTARVDRGRDIRPRSERGR